MKKQMIQIISAILVIITVLSVPTLAGFSNSDINDVITGITEFLTGTTSGDGKTTTEPATEETTDPETEPATEPTTEPTTGPSKTFDDYNDNDKVAVMYICTQQVGLGHAWIYIENMAECNLEVGCYDLKPDCGVSMGTFLLSRSDGGGLYYNVEAYCANKWGLKNQRWLKTELTKKQLIKVSKRIRQWNYWDFYFNCTFFASAPACLISSCIAERISSVFEIQM